jgi:excinuclease ABC subunit C
MYFGTAKAVEQASLDDLARTPGINLNMARMIFDFFHDGGG